MPLTDTQGGPSPAIGEVQSMGSVRINFDEGDFKARILAAAKTKAKQHLAEQLDGLRCEEHGKIPELVNDGGEQVTFRSCCEKLHTRVHERLSQYATKAKREDDNVPDGGVAVDGAPDANARAQGEDVP